MTQENSYTAQQLKIILEEHRKWRYGEEGGKRANLYGANLYGANLRSADLRSANLRSADLGSADLGGAKSLNEARGLDIVKHDIWSVLDVTPLEVPGLVKALAEGKVDGGMYEGACACLVGTLANTRGCHYEAIEGLKPDASRPAEVWFTAIRPGDTPDRSGVAALTLKWIAEWQERTDRLVAAFLKRDLVAHGE